MEPLIAHTAFSGLAQKISARYSPWKANMSSLQMISFSAGKKRAGEILNRLWLAPVNKNTVRGIHGTLFYELDHKKPFYPTKKESEMTTGLERERTRGPTV